ncbi:hypothetical protein [uncultured Microbacterium sp.]|uniref:aggregation-promoting factor C-terminal-like domain-containing protein n=1 Tax=uncultured Microbacterium sp. TaxID=191216 RepID=UPI0025DBC74E|nr:hypothetical protein [uncultured Microbacterium sp.]
MIVSNARRRPASGHGRPRRALLSVGAVGILLCAALALPAPSARADDYPSWQDVQNAQGDEQATQTEIGRIDAALADAQKRAADASAAAMTSAQAARAVRAQADAAARRADELGAQAAAAQDRVQSTHDRIGAVVAGRARTEQAAPLSVRLFTGADPDQLLARLGVMQQLDETWSALGSQAIAARDVAASLQSQATSAEKARDDLAATAEQSARAAQDAADAEAAAVQDLQGHVTTLYAQLAVLKNTTADVERRYRIGQEVAEQEREEKAREDAAAAAAAGSSGTDGGGANVDPAGAQAYARGQLGSYGWADDQFGCLYRLWMQESSWRADALNPDSGAYGIPQALPATKLASAGPDWRTNGNTQIDWGLSYIQDRYGSPCGAWSHEVAHNWY